MVFQDRCSQQLSERVVFMDVWTSWAERNYLDERGVLVFSTQVGVPLQTALFAIAYWNTQKWEEQRRRFGVECRICESVAPGTF